MLSFAFTDEQEMFRESIRELTERRFSKDYCREVEAREDQMRGDVGREGQGLLRLLTGGVRVAAVLADLG